LHPTHQARRADAVHVHTARQVVRVAPLAAHACVHSLFGGRSLGGRAWRWGPHMHSVGVTHRACRAGGGHARTALASGGGVVAACAHAHLMAALEEAAEVGCKGESCELERGAQQGLPLAMLVIMAVVVVKVETSPCTQMPMVMPQPLCWVDSCAHEA